MGNKINFDKYQALYLVVLALVGFLIYANTFQSPFFFDDNIIITDNPAIRMQEFSWDSIVNAVSGKGRNRPVSTFSFALNYYFDQYNPFGYHLVNIIVHISAGILLFFFLKTTLSISNRQADASPSLDTHGVLWVSGLTALFWFVNPVHTQSVTYVVQRMNSMAAMFFILTLLLYAKGRLAQRDAADRRSTTRMPNHYLWFLGSALAGVLALGSKENSAILPVFVFLYEWYFFQNLSKNWLKKHLIVIVIPAMLFILVALMHLGLDPWEKFNSLRDFSKGHFSMDQRLLTQSRVVIYYLSLIFYPNPSRLNLDYDFPLSVSLFHPLTTMPALIGIGGLVILGIVLARKQRVMSFCILWFLGNLVIESSVIPLAIIFEHRVYLPSMLICLPPIILLYRHLNLKWLPIGISCALIMLSAYWTFERNHVWQDGITLWADCIKKSPNKARPYLNLGVYQKRLNMMDAAYQNLQKAVELDPEYAEAYFNLGALFNDQGQTEKALAHFRSAIDIRPNFAKAHNNLGEIYLKQDKPNEAIEHFLKALKTQPNYSRAYYNLGEAYRKLGKVEEAIENYLIALPMTPELPATLFNLGNALLSEGKVEQAIAHFKITLKLDPENDEAHNNLGGQLLKQGELDQALIHLKQAVRINPELVETHNNIGIILIQQGSLEAAIKHFQEAVRIRPDFRMAANNLERALAIQKNRDMESENIQQALGNKPDDPALHFKMANNYLRKGDLGQAIAEYEKALALKPDFLPAMNNLAMAYASDRQYHQALVTVKKLLELDPENAGNYYNIAALYALQNKVSDSITWLKKAIDHGYQNWELIKTDPDLANIRTTDDYKLLIKDR